MIQIKFKRLEISRTVFEYPTYMPKAFEGGKIAPEGENRLRLAVYNSDTN